MSKEENIKSYTDFILKWNRLMLSNRGIRLLNLIKEKKFKNKYIECLESLILSPELINSLEQFEDPSIVQEFHKKLIKFAELFIFSPGKSEKNNE